jgi:flavin reductase (DIM6/NTAB) family NADH-FMN oxidoreductase RutF
MCYISVRPQRHSYDIIRNDGEFVINLTTAELAHATDWCGVKSGRDHNKFREMKLTPLPGRHVKAPVIAESPVNIECRVSDIIELGVHHMFLAEVLGIQASEKYYDKDTEAFDLNRAGVICYSHGKYYQTGNLIGKFGFSVRKKKRKNKGR